MKQSAELRTGEYMDVETAEMKAEDLLNLLIQYGLVRDQGQNRWLILELIPLRE